MAGYHAFGSLKKYLMFLSYAGKEFRGMQRQIPYFQRGNIVNVNTVQQTLEDALQLVCRPLHDVRVNTSSRTDAGVHALRTSVHFYLQMERDTHPDLITSGLNKHFLANSIGIRIQSTHTIPEWFSSQVHATSRTYLYRFAFLKEPRQAVSIAKYTGEIPFSEHGRTYFLPRSDIDIGKMKEAAALLIGTKDFYCFMGKPSKKPSSQSTIRSLYSLNITSSQPFMGQHDPNAHLFSYWDVICHGRSFLYRQIRRTMGVLLAVGQSDMDLKSVKKLLDQPVAESWDPRAVCVPPWGLYLLNVTYNPLDSMESLEFIEPEEENARTTLALSS